VSRTEEKAMQKGFRTVVVALALLAMPLVFVGDTAAASTVNARFQFAMSGSIESDTGLARGTAALASVWTTDLKNGILADQADLVYTLKAQSIASAGTLSIDVAGTLTDPFGTAFTPAKLRVVWIYSRSNNTTDLTLLGGGAAVPILNTAATTATLRPGGMFLTTDSSTTGIPVTATTADIIQIVNAAGAAALVDVVLVGTSS
jgi:hypothetical protein